MGEPWWIGFQKTGGGLNHGLIHGDIRGAHSQDFHHDIGGGFRKFTPFHHVLETLRNQWILRNILTKTTPGFNGTGRRTENHGQRLFWGLAKKFRSPSKKTCWWLEKTRMEMRAKNPVVFICLQISHVFLECKDMIQKLNWNQASCGHVSKIWVSYAFI